jgi:radical SAM protein with 4Fe4S-binding SPASM domain
MEKIEKLMNRRIVKRILLHYFDKGRQRVGELFGDAKERSIGAFFGRIPVRLAVNVGMKRIGLTPEMRNEFLSHTYNRQTFLNLLATVGRNGLTLPFRFEGPALIVWNYTNLCNLRCRYCYQGAGTRKNEELSFSEKIDAINQMVDANTTYLAFSGGEPLMGERFWDVLTYASKFLHTAVATNGTLLTDRKMVERLADCGAQNVFVSLDGASPLTHDFIRGEGSFQRSIQGIANLVQNEHLNVGINTVVTKRNFGEVPAILELAKDLGVNSFSHYNFIPTGRGKDDFDQDLTPDQREELLNLLYDWHARRNETKLNIISTAPSYARVLIDRSSGGSSGLFHYTADEATAITGVIKYAGGCGAGRVYAALQPDGKVTPCVFMPTVVVGDLRESRLIDVWRGSELCKQLSDREHFHHTCSGYRYVCGGCRARALAYGDILGGDPGCRVYQKSIHGVDEEEKTADRKVKETVAV